MTVGPAHFAAYIDELLGWTDDRWKRSVAITNGELTAVLSLLQWLVEDGRGLPDELKSAVVRLNNALGEKSYQDLVQHGDLRLDQRRPQDR
jgi:hypothetical protein